MQGPKMRPFPQSSPRSTASQRGFSLVELLIAMMVTTFVLAASSKFMSMMVQNMRRYELMTEATFNARAAIDTIVRDLRLSGACLPITGDFMSLDGNHNNNTDTIITRTGLVRPDMSCVRTATTVAVTSAASIPVSSASGFTVGMRAYIRNPTIGDYFDITGINTVTNTISGTGAFANGPYPIGSGVYAIDERSYFLANRTTAGGTTSQLMLQIGSQTAQAFAVGVDTLNFSYQLKRNCPTCDVVQIPASGNDDEWRLVQQITVSLSARADRTNPDGVTYERRTMTVNVKPRNLLPQ